MGEWVTVNSPFHLSEWVRNHLLIWVREWVRTHLLIWVCVCEWELTSRFQCVYVSENSPPDFNVCLSVSSPPDFSVWVSENSPPNLSVRVWVREHSPPHLCLWVRERTHLPSALPSNQRQTDGHTRFSTETLNPKPEHTQDDTLTLSDTDTQSDFSFHWQFSQPTQEFTHYTKGPCFPHKQTGHRVILMTLRDTSDTKWYPLPWVPANRISDGRTDEQTHQFCTEKNPIFIYKQMSMCCLIRLHVNMLTWFIKLLTKN